MDRRNLIIKINYVSGSKFNFKYIPLDVLQAAAISAVGGVADEGGSSVVGGVCVYVCVCVCACVCVQA